MGASFEFECRGCGLKLSQSHRSSPQSSCEQCGACDWRRVWGFGVVWPKDQRGH